MRIAIIGGHDRSGTSLAQVARRCGHELEFHPGHVAGRGSDEIRAIVGRAELVLVLTDLNSHGAVHVARKAAQKLGRDLVLMKRVGLKNLAKLLEQGEEPTSLRLAS